MDGPKVNHKLALVKLGHMLESLSIPRYSPKGSDNVMGADDQQERPESVLKQANRRSMLVRLLVLRMGLAWMLIAVIVVIVMAVFALLRV